MMDINATPNRETITMSSAKALSTLLLAILLITVAGCAGSPTSESTGEYIDDTWITSRVKAALIDDSVVKATEVNVETFKSVVQLSGFVSSKEAMDKAVVVAGSIDGVVSVRNDMQIKQRASADMPQ